MFIALVFSIRAGEVSNRLTFGSCNKFFNTMESSIFTTIADTEPDYFVWLGDVVYADGFFFLNVHYVIDDEGELRANFDNTYNDPYYSILRNATEILGVWDDHDYGINNGDKYFSNKVMMREIWLDFMDEPKDSIRRTREGGIYESYDLYDGKVKLILLDVR